VDVALDTFPYNGGTTTTEALWQGVPVVCYYGDRWVGRTSATLMRAAGLGEYVAIGVEGYVALAAELAQPGAAQRLSDLRGEMRAMLGASAACDTAGLARDMEGLYKGMWRRWCEGR
jgi:protein O-GlcNAc transferase